MTSLKRKIRNADDTVNELAEELAMRDAVVKFDLLIQPIDVATQEPPHGHYGVRCTFFMPLHGKSDHEFAVTATPEVVKSFQRFSGHNFSIDMKVQIDTCASDMEVTSYCFSRGGVGAFGKRDRSKESEFLEFFYVDDSDPDGEQWRVTFDWNREKPNVLKSVSLEHDPAEHPRLNANLCRESHEIARRRVMRLAKIAAEAKSDQDELLARKQLGEIKTGVVAATVD